jgi:ribonuclease HI
MPELKKVTIYTDGGAAPNPGRGGYGVVLRSGKKTKQLSGGYQWTTNNRMELMAVIVGLEALKERCCVKLHTDSKYIVDAIKKGWAVKWRMNGWAKDASKTTFAKNPDLWERLLAVYEKHEVEIIWVKGHAGIADNELCDQLATAAIQQANLPPDIGYKSESLPPAASKTSDPAEPKTKIREVGQPCRSCQNPVIKKAPKKKTLKPDQAYYYAWYLFCPGCQKRYMVEEAKREVSDGRRRIS